MSEGNTAAAKPTIVIVDDAPENIRILSSILNGVYRTKAATSGAKAIEICNEGEPPDLVLLDVMMPGIDGLEVCRQIRGNYKTRDVPVIFLTAKSTMEDERKGFEAGGVDYITKPISPPVVEARVKTHLELKSARDILKSRNEYLEQEVARRTEEIAVIQDVTMAAMGSLAETRDNETGNHIRRTQHYIKVIALQMSAWPEFSDYLDRGTIELLYKSAPLHDIGKVGIPDSILLKPGKLTVDEFEVMKTHTTLGRDSIMAAERLLPTQTSFLALAREIAWCHHEKWNGSGYPRGLSGTSIPISGRLMAVVDVYDALMSKRVYKSAMSHEESVEVIEGGAGTHFDPNIVEGFLQVAELLKSVAKKFADEAVVSR